MDTSFINAVFVFTGFSKKKYDKDEIESLLSRQYNQNITNFDVEIVYVEDLYNGGAGPYKTYYRIHEICAIISFIVPKDENGSKYKAQYYVPYSMVKDKNSDTNPYNQWYCYIYDKWISGPRFESSIVVYSPEKWFKIIIEKILE